MNRKPVQYIPGLGRGAVGFTTRSDVGPAATSSTVNTEVVGSRAAEVRAALKHHQQLQQLQQLQQQQHKGGLFGSAPEDYVPGAGRGAGRLSKGGDDDTGPVGSYDPFSGYGSFKEPEEGQFDEDDDEADRMWAAVDERMSSRRRKRKLNENDQEDDEDQFNSSKLSTISIQFRELKEKLADVTEDQWANIPDVGDHSLKYKQHRRQQDAITPLSDSLLEQRSKNNKDSTALPSGVASAVDGLVTTTNMAGLSAARNTVLGMSLDKMSDSVTGQTNVDPAGYLTSLSSTKIATNAEIGDINKARLLLKSVRETNPGHSPGWIAAARVEEAAGKTLQARKIIQEGCSVCPDSEDVWLEAARLHPHEVGKSILATAVRRIPHSVKLFLKAADMEHSEVAKRAVLRKALEANPSSITLWKAAIELEDADDAKILLSVAIEKVPQSVEMWLALARLETYENARKVLNKARKTLPTERAIWIAAAKLEESQLSDTETNPNDSKKKDAENLIHKIIERAVKSLEQHSADVSRSQWLQEAESAEKAGAPLTSAAIIRQTVGKDVEAEDRQRTWTEDAKSSLARGFIATSRAIIEHALATFPSKKSLWMLAVDLETKHGNADTLDDVLAAASQRLPRAEIFWLLRAKEKWLAGSVDEARTILTDAFAANPDSEAVWLAAAKLEWENSEIERARVLLERARQRAPSDRVYMKSALLEREDKKFGEALQLIEQGIALYPKFHKLYMMGGQICSDDLVKQKSSLERARKFYQRGLENCPDNVDLWILASRLEERSMLYDPETTAKPGASVTKARSLLEVARLNIPKNPLLWLEAVRLERRAGNHQLSETFMSKALQECPGAAILLAECIYTASRVEKKSKAADAIKRCPDDPLVTAAVATLFATERKTDKARKWFDRAVILDPTIGDSWARFYAFEQELGGQKEQEKVMSRCLDAKPKYGEIWTSVVKDMSNRHKPLSDCLTLAAKQIRLRSVITHS